MKKLVTASLFVFWAIVTAILVAGLVFYQNGKNNQTKGTTTDVIQSTFDQINSTKGVATSPSGTTKTNTTTTTPTKTTTSTKVTSITLSMEEISDHNKQTDCWILISGKVYNITSYFGSHPGGSQVMALTCGKDATAAYYTQDPYATTASSKSRHSSRAQSLLENYYIGDLNQTISK